MAKIKDKEYRLSKAVSTSLGRCWGYSRTGLNGAKKEFLNEWMTSFSKVAKKYIDNVKGDAPYVYTEREMNGALLIALDEFADACLAETPTRRENGAYRIKDRTNKHGRVDFYARYKKQDFFIESKHCFVSRRSKMPRPGVHSRLKNALNQLRQSENTNRQSTQQSKVPHLAILTVVLYTVTSENKRTYVHPDWDDLMVNYYSSFSDDDIPLDYIGRIVVSDENVERTAQFIEETGRTWKYHGLLFIAKYLK